MCIHNLYKLFLIYEENCKNLLKLKFEKKNNKTREKALEFLDEIDDNFDYFTEICKKANELKEIADNKIDFKMILNNYIGIDNEKYEKNDKPINTNLIDFGD